ncbi:MAG: hypothetical protein GC179_23910 [Anaerolineaceae bacterium]|nr:hypothetical protein [Anaerolineaceae bacterium]
MLRRLMMFSPLKIESSSLPCYYGAGLGMGYKYMLFSPLLYRLLSCLALLLLAGCTGGAVVFAPPPPPPDISALLYTHPAGIFTVSVPRNWSVYEQNTTVVASVSFSPPAEDQPWIEFAVMNIGQPFNSGTFGSLIDRYQQQIRPDVTYYTEISRQAMGDGSWRMSGVRHLPGGLTQPLNTFIQQSGTFLSVIDVLVSADAKRMTELQQIINTFSVNLAAQLDVADPKVLGYASPSAVEFLHVATWSTPQNVFFITGEVANRGTTQLTDIPIRAVLKSADNVPIAEAVDTVMGYSLPPGGFAPFSLRFGQGQPSLTTNFDLYLGNKDWKSQPDRAVYGQDELSWEDKSSFEADGSMVIDGTVRNISQNPILSPRVVTTIFDSAGNVIAAGFVDLTAALNPSDSTAFRILVPEMGGQPANYIVNVQALK